MSIRAATAAALLAAFAGLAGFGAPGAEAAKDKSGGPEDDTTTLTSRKYLEDVQEVIDAGVNPRVTGGNIAVHFHVVNKGPGTADGNVTDSQIAAQIGVLNSAFQPWGWTFTLVDVSRITNASWFTTPKGEEFFIKRTLRRGSASRLNIYTWNVPDGNLGWSSFPWEFTGNPSNDGVVILYSTLPGGAAAPYNLGDTAVHHVGHWMGLLHTFEGKCHKEGDFVSDTNAHEEPNYGGPVGADTCRHEPGLDPITNFMNFTDDAVMDRFTSGQDARMDTCFSIWRFGK